MSEHVVPFLFCSYALLLHLLEMFNEQINDDGDDDDGDGDGDGDGDDDDDDDDDDIQEDRACEDSALCKLCDTT